MALGIPSRDRSERYHRRSLTDFLQEEKMAVVIDTIKKLNAGALSLRQIWQMQLMSVIRI
jgi:hypothetical protein